MTNVDDSTEERNIPVEENEKPHFVKNLVRLAFLGLLGILFLSLSSVWISKVFSVDIQALMSGNIETGNERERSALRLLLVLNSVLAFILPAFIYNMVSDRKYIFNKIGIESTGEQGKKFIWAVGLFILSLPLVMFTAWVNQKIPLPEWASQTEENVSGLLKMLLSEGTTTSLILNIVMLALLPATGEEWFFRGSLQRIFTQMWGDTHHIKAILLTAFLFSLLHFQFEGFLPRLLLGVVLGFIFYKTGNIWVAVFCHFLFNASQILVAYMTQNDAQQIDAEKMDSPPLLVVVVCSILFFILYKYSPGIKTDTDEQI